ncbi:MAG: ECF transporter S component [Rikenellaceae bacterium]
MQTNELKLYSLSLSEVKSYLVAMIFIVGNMALPQLCHAIPNGGVMLLPIYFFTLTAAYKYGWQVGLLTAVVSPVANSLIFGMPMMAVLPIILVKSTLLALSAGYVAHRFARTSILSFVVIVASYQTVGTLVEWAMVGDFWRAIQDFRVGLPGMLIQVFGGCLFVKYLLRK